MKPFDISPRVTMAELLGNSREYIVPHFQRDYSWDDEEWGELWEDIERMGADGRHYMGYIVLQELPDSRTRRVIIDGQQRLATLSIFALAVISLLDGPASADRLFHPAGDGGKPGDGLRDNQRRRDELRNRFLEWSDPVSLTPRPRLGLSDENNGFYRNHILRLRKPAGMNRVSRSNRQMWKALEFFRARTRERYGEAPAGEDLARLLSETVATGLFFTEMCVSDEESAYAIFETLNARGAMLSSPDLLKNFLFSTVTGGRTGGGDEDIQRLKSQWGGMLGALERHNPTTFVRHLWHSMGNDFVQKRGLFKAMRGKIEDGGAEAVFALMDKLEDGAETYADMLSPTARAWPNKRQLFHLRNLDLYGVTSHFPLTLAAVRKWRKSPKFAQLLRWCDALSFRRTVIGGQNPNELERVYAKAADEIHRGGPIAAVCGLLKSADVTDDFFVSAFADYDAESQSRKKLAKHILLEIERRTGGSRHDPESPDITIEHILPRNPDEGWDDFGSGADRFIWRLGNLTLLESSRNRNCGNLLFAQKREIYRGSRFAMTRELAKRGEWTPAALESRQREFAELAKAIWRLE